MTTKRLNPVGMIGGNFNIVDNEKFQSAIRLLRESLFDGGQTMFCADNLITWNKNLSFLRDPFFLDNLKDKNVSDVEKGIVWRNYVLLYFAEIASHVEGDFLELGCYTGHTASRLVRKLDLGALGKKYYLYDLFGWVDGDEHTLLPGHNNSKMFEDVVSRFSDYPYVRVIRGSVPESFAQGFPERIAFAHIDMNHPDPEAGALEAVLPRLSSGGAVVFDDYGWWGYSAQKIAIDPIVEKHGLKLLELPTGQAVLLKPLAATGSSGAG